jgi:hypothetical protein
MQVVDELDEKKYTGSDKVRGKARTALTHIRTLVGADGAPGPSASAPVAASLPASQPPTGIADELAKLAQLRDLGVLTDDEFMAQKAKLLGG